MLTMNKDSGRETPRRACARAVLRGTRGALCVEVLGYEFPDRFDGFDADWLVVRVECVHGSRWIRSEGPILLADELAAWSAWLITAANEDTTLAFTEPNLYFAWRKNAAKPVVDVEVLRESPEGNRRMPASFSVHSEDLVRFGHALARIARRYPVRSERTANGTVS